MRPSVRAPWSPERSGSPGRFLLPVFLLLLPGIPGCAGPAAVPGAALDEGAPEEVWEELHRSRPAPLDGAARVSVSELLLPGGSPWEIEAAVSPDVGLLELVAANLLRRRDVRFVERRRFSEAAERERRGLPAPDGQPPVGRSPGAEYVLTGSWGTFGGDTAYLNLRLVRAATGETVEAWRTPTPRDADPVGVARTIAGGLLTALDALEHRPQWDDPLDGPGLDPAPEGHRSSGVPPDAVEAFLRGVAAEDRFRWEAARRAYQQAREIGGTGFFEPEVALARVARLRAGGTLGESP